MTLTAGARAKEGMGGGGGEFQHGAFASKLRAQRKGLHGRLGGNLKMTPYLFGS